MCCKCRSIEIFLRNMASSNGTGKMYILKLYIYEDIARNVSASPQVNLCHISRFLKLRRSDDKNPTLYAFTWMHGYISGTEVIRKFTLMAGFPACVL